MKVKAKSSTCKKYDVFGLDGWSLVNILNNSGTKTLPWGKPFFCDLHRFPVSKKMDLKVTVMKKFTEYHDKFIIAGHSFHLSQQP